MYKCLVTGKTFSNTKLEQAAFSGDGLECCPHCGDTPWAGYGYSMMHVKCSEDEVSNPNPVSREERFNNFLLELAKRQGSVGWAVDYGFRMFRMKKEEVLAAVEEVNRKLQSERAAKLPELSVPVGARVNGAKLVREQIRNAKQLCLPPEAVVEWAVNNLGMGTAVAKAYISNYW